MAKINKVCCYPINKVCCYPINRVCCYAINKNAKKLKNQKTKKLNPWLENKNLALRARTLLFTNAYNKIQRIRSFSKYYSSRAARYGALTIISMLLLIILGSSFLPKNKFQLAKERLLKNPNDQEAHLILIEEFLRNNDLNKAEKELQQAQQLEQSANASNQQSKVLGLSSRLNDLGDQWREQNPEELEKLIAKWEEVVSETPTYRDGYLYLAIYYFKLKDHEKAKENLNKAAELDPNYKITRELKKTLGN